MTVQGSTTLKNGILGDHTFQVSFDRGGSQTQVDPDASDIAGHAKADPGPDRRQMPGERGWAGNAESQT